MIEKYCEISLSDDIKLKIRNDNKIQTLTIKHLIAKYLLSKNFIIKEYNIEEIISNINKL